MSSVRTPDRCNYCPGRVYPAAVQPGLCLTDWSFGGNHQCSGSLLIKVQTGNIKSEKQRVVGGSEEPKCKWEDSGELVDEPASLYFTRCKIHTCISWRACKKTPEMVTAWKKEGSRRCKCHHFRLRGAKNAMVGEIPGNFSKVLVKLVNCVKTPKLTAINGRIREFVTHYEGNIVYWI